MTLIIKCAGKKYSKSFTAKRLSTPTPLKTTKFKKTLTPQERASLINAVGVPSATVWHKEPDKPR